MINPSRTLAVVLLINVFTTGHIYASSFDYGASFGVEKFLWKEFGDEGERLLTESGPRLSFNAFLGNIFLTNHGFIYNTQATLYFGTVNYDGQTQDGVPATSDTEYFGFNIEGEAGYRLGVKPDTFAWDFTGSLGFDNWVRTIASGTDINGNIVSGAEETYNILNLRAGTGPSWQNGNWQARFMIGAKYPFWTNEFLASSDTGFVDDLNLQPKGRISPYAVFNNRIRVSKKTIMTIDAYYDTYRFDESDQKLTRAFDGAYYLVHQPKSEQTTYGLKVGVVLKH